MTFIEKIWFRVCFAPLLILFVAIHSCVAFWVILKKAWRFESLGHFTDISVLTLTGSWEAVRCISQNLDKIQKEFVNPRIRKQGK